MASYNDLGTIGDDGVTRDAAGNEVPIGLDDAAKADLKRLASPPKVRHAPSERDAFVAAGGTLKADEYKLEDSTPSGGREDIEKQEKEAKPSTSKASK